MTRDRERELNHSTRVNSSRLRTSAVTDVIEGAVALSPKTFFVKDSERREAAREFEGLLWGSCLYIYFSLHYKYMLPVCYLTWCLDATLLDHCLGRLYLADMVFTEIPLVSHMENSTELSSPWLGFSIGC